MLLSTILLLLELFYAFTMEIDAGYYDCKNCHNKFVPSYIEAMIHPVFGTTRYLKCPKCSKRTWAKKVMAKEQ